MHKRDDRLKNALLACLSDEAWSRWLHMSDVLELAQGQSMDQALGGTGCVYFPLGAVLALHAITEEGAYSELALVGREGMLGISGFMGGGTFFSHAIVLKGGADFAHLGAGSTPRSSKLAAHDDVHFQVHAGLGHPHCPDRGVQSAPLD